MPSIRKRIGYLPSNNIQEIITKISNKEKLSQSKVVGLLVEEALIARGLFDVQKTNNLIKKNKYKNYSNIMDSSFEYSDNDELISDQGVTYNTKNYKPKSNYLSYEPKEAYNKELFEQFKQFILFQKMIEEK
tara:strand:- start:156 stop:551 length:396 start_codon:yes stop_codon:yes gene_type:complete